MISPYTVDRYFVVHDVHLGRWLVCKWTEYAQPTRSHTVVAEAYDEEYAWQIVRGLVES